MHQKSFTRPPFRWVLVHAFLKTNKILFSDTFKIPHDTIPLTNLKYVDSADILQAFSPQAAHTTAELAK